MDNLSVISYNPTGLNAERQEYIHDILSEERIDIMLLQETWLYKSESKLLDNIHKMYTSCAISGMDETQEIRQGRKYGGVGIMWHSRISKSVRTYSNHSKRMCGITITLDNEQTLFILNVYLPCDNYRQTQADE